MTETIDNTTEQELFEHFNICVDKGQMLMRMDKFLAHRIVNRSRSKIQTSIEAGNVLVNDKTVKSNYQVKPLDNIKVLMEYPPTSDHIIPENIPLDIIFEDNEILVINKNAGLVVHPGVGNSTGTLVNAVAFHLQNLPLFNEKENMRPGLVHRIDKNTSGIIVMAKNDFSLAYLGKQFFDHSIERVYRAVVWGVPKKSEGTITSYLGRDKRDHKKMFSYEHEEDGKLAITHYKVIEHFNYASLIECRLETGRTHQIRVHMASIGHPVFNDEGYGGNQILKGLPTPEYKKYIQHCFELCPRHALHAKFLAFTHPKSLERLSFDSAYAEDIEKLLAAWRQKEV